MNRDKQINIHIASDKDMNQTFINAWKKAEQGEQPEGEQHLYFEDAASFLKVLSNQRLMKFYSILINFRMFYHVIDFSTCYQTL
ncbi:MAG: hypothetical protein K8S13_22780 [Desulfobacula sp.]|uniref:hypothetical protein n=1 Tax=Desulfobacula sp. TaxID=2593537 RepID=UPI0025C1722B|nr:hypothetical protein [Desulfobacula sp.]MCD4722655.1 hypothetical protein [Desulfobacula sp.]